MGSQQHVVGKPEQQDSCSLSEFQSKIQLDEKKEPPSSNRKTVHGSNVIQDSLK